MKHRNSMFHGDDRAMDSSDADGRPARDFADDPAPLTALRTLVYPHRALRGLVQLYFEVGHEPEPRSRRVLPDGSVDIIFNLNDRTGTIAGTLEPHACVIGVLTAPLTVERPSGSPVFGISVAPGAARSFLNVPLRELKNRVIDLHSLWGADADEALARLRTAPTSRGRAAVMDALLMSKLTSVPAPDPVLGAAVTFIRANGGRLPTNSVASTLGVSERRLERAFAAGTGLSPKEFSRIARIQTALAWIGRAASKRPPWVDLANDLGFADQAHLIREFRVLTGVTPVDYARENGLSYVFNDGLAEP